MQSNCKTAQLLYLFGGWVGRGNRATFDVQGLLLALDQMGSQALAPGWLCPKQTLCPRYPLSSPTVSVVLRGKLQSDSSWAEMVQGLRYLPCMWQRAVRSSALQSLYWEQLPQVELKLAPSLHRLWPKTLLAPKQTKPKGTASKTAPNAEMLGIREALAHETTQGAI